MLDIATRACACVIVAALLVGGAACNRGADTAGGPSIRRTASDPTIAATPLAAATGATGGFTRLQPPDSGITFMNTVADPERLAGDLLLQGGVAAGDYDADGDLDLYLTNLEGPNQLLRNEGGMKFADATAAAGEGLDGGAALGTGAYFVDLNGDGNLDLYVCNRLEANQAFLGDGKGGFAAAADALGLGSEYCTAAAAFFDADSDGDLDCYLANHHPSQAADELQAAWAEGKLGAVLPANIWPAKRPNPSSAQSHDLSLPVELQEKYYVDDSGLARLRPHPQQFFVNDGKGGFTDATEKAGFTHLSYSWQPLACDFNDDGLTDLYVSSDFETPDRYYINNGDGTFTDRGPEMVRKTPLYSMGCDAGDLNLDGRMDLFTSDMLAKDYKRAKTQSGDMHQWRWEFFYQRPQPQMRNMLYVNRGEGWLAEIGQMCGVNATEWTWSARIADLNGDGIPELLATNGMTRDAMDVDSIREKAQLFAAGLNFGMFSQRGAKDPYYTEDFIFTASEPLKYDVAMDNWGLHDESMGCGAALQDFDGDGDPDLVMNNTNKPVGVWRNDTGAGTWATFDLRQGGANRHAFGTRVWAMVGERTLTQDVIASRGFATGESGRIHFGLGDHGKIDGLKIRWPDGALQEYETLPGGMHYVITRAEKLPQWAPEKAEPYFAQSALDWQQMERDTQEAEFEAEPLLPFQLSMNGSGIGLADYDGDGNLDVYCAGAAGQRGQLLRGDGQGGFKAADGVAPDKPELQEEMAALWFEANGDGKADLLITSGSNEAPAGDAAYQPRLLLSGADGLREAELPTRHVSSGAAAAGDIDGDGDLDLVIAGQQVPLRYAAKAPTVVWANDGAGKFTEATAALAPGLDQLRPVNDVQLADVSGDGAVDLVVAEYWGLLQVWTNGGGKLAKAHELAGAGWWQGLGIGDFDNDGDLDVLASNTGTNTKYKPKDGAPVTLFAADFDNSGTRDLIEVKYGKLNGEACMLPGRGRSCSGYAISYIPDKWPTWKSFAEAKLEDVYGPGLSSAERFDATELHSVVCLNEGESWSMHELPGFSQWAPGMGVAVGDFDADGNLDAFMAQNWSATQPETGHWNAGYGQLLLGGGDGSFRAVDMPEAGLRMPGDMRGAVAAELNGDGLLDLLVSACNGAPQAAVMRAEKAAGRGLLVRLDDPQGGVGARISLSLSDGRTLTRYAQAGCGYLSSCAGPVHFGIPEGQTATKLSVQWPGGASSELTDAAALEQTEVEVAP